MFARSSREDGGDFKFKLYSRGGEKVVFTERGEEMLGAMK